MTPADATSPSPSPPVKFPSGLTLVLLLLACLLGAWRTVAGGGALVMNLTQTKESALEQVTSWKGLGGASPAKKSSQREMEEKTREMTVQALEVQWRYRPALLALGFLQLPAAVLLLVGAVGTWRRQERQRRLLRAVCLASIPVQVASTVVGAVVSLATLQLMSDFAATMAPDVAKEPQATAILGGVMRAVGAMTLTFSVVLGLAMVGYFVVLWRQLNKPEVRLHFTGAATPAATP